MDENKNKAVFLDRDGVINVDKSYVYKIEDFEFCDGIKEVLKSFKERGYLLIVVTNQSGIGRGYYSEEEFKKLTQWMDNELRKEGIFLDGVYFCPHKPDELCRCRKPDSKMFEDAIKDFDINPAKSWMIGDKISDIEAANKAHIFNTILLNHQNIIDPKNLKKQHPPKQLSLQTKPKFIVNSIFDTISCIL